MPTQYDKTALPSEAPQSTPVTESDIETHYNKLLRSIKELWAAINGTDAGNTVDGVALENYTGDGLIDRIDAAATGATIAETGTGTSTTKFTTPDSVAAIYGEKGTDIASATTLSIPTTGNYFDVTGTTTIEGLGSPSNRITGWTVFLKFEGALTLTHNATSLILPGGANITTADGDVALFKYEGSGNWRCVHYMVAATAPGSGGGSSNYFGDGSDGDVTTAGNVSHTSTLDGDPVVKNYTNLTISTGDIMTVSNRCKGLLLYVNGDLTVNGTLHMDSKGASAANVADVGISKNTSSGGALDFFSTESNQNAPASLTNYTMPNPGASGGAAITSGNNDGNPGSAGTSGATGGGGSGASSVASSLGNSGAGGAGSTFTGGSGGGAGGYTTTGTNGTAGSSTGGAGGAAGTTTAGTVSAGGGAGNPGGAGANGGSSGGAGGGGFLVIVCSGSVTVGASGTISANGGAGGGGGTTGTNYRNGGGGAGGGSVIILYAGSYTNNGTVQANGGAGGASSGGATHNGQGGAGGAGSVRTALIGGA